MSDADIMAEAYASPAENTTGQHPSVSPASKPPTPVGARRLSGIVDLSSSGSESQSAENGIHGPSYPNLVGLSGANMGNGGGPSASLPQLMLHCILGCFGGLGSQHHQ
ncbi:hypothetical protein C0Q70_03158 [Pomacea canaliculata]|uniref:Uncharacterized protein n=1 Tax=Pomacea canaliculata TaxID=400727 RepID=A0A2T7PRY2_POMCA|nr:hypothetical protein C0Q70_03158 [Pomacea canaliculata]